MISLLDESIPNAQNFTWNEFVKTQIGIRNNINNLPNSQIIWNNIQSLSEHVLQPLRDQFGPIIISSGYRSSELNKLIGGSPNSNHIRGEAADILPLKNIPLIEILSFIYKNLPFRELIAEYFPNGWIHVAYRKNGNDRTLKIKDSDHYYTHMSLDEFLNL